MAVVSLLFIAALRAGAGPACAALLWLSAISAGLGYQMLRWARHTSCYLHRLETFLFSLLLGFGGLAFATAALAWFGRLDPDWTRPMLVLLSIPAATEGWRRLRTATLPTPREWLERDLRVSAGGTAGLVLCFGTAFVWAIAPSSNWDAMIYHLPLPTQYASHRGFIDLPELSHSYFGGQAHVLYALAFTLGGQPLPGLLHFTFGLIATGLTFALAARLAGKLAGWAAALMFASMPLVTWEAGTAYIDLLVTAYTLGCFFALQRWWEEHRNGWLVVAGVLGGMAVGIKLNAGLLLAPAVIIVTCATVARLGVRSVGPLCAFLLPLVLVPAPWLVRNWLWVGNPVYPLLGPLFPNARLPVLAPNFGYYGVGHDVLALVRLPYDLVVRGDAFVDSGYGPLGVVPLLALAAPLAPTCVPWRTRKFLLAASLLAVVPWFWSASEARLLLPLLPLFVVLSVLPLGHVVAWGSTAPRMALPALGVAVLVYLAATRGLVGRSNEQIPEGYPYKLALGLETPDQFLTRAVHVYRAFQFINAQDGGDARVLGAGVAIRLYLNGEIHDIEYSPSANALASLSPGPEFAAELVRRGYQYIVVDWERLHRYPAWEALPYANRDFLREFTQLQFAYADVYVYRLGADGARRPTLELLANTGFDEPVTDGRPPAWRAFGEPQVVTDATAAHSAPTFVVVSAADGFYQVFDAAPDELYTVRLWARSADPGAAVWLQIAWLDAQDHQIDTGITPVSVGPEWELRQASFSAVDRRIARGVVYARAAPGAHVSVDDISVIAGG